jgi:DNA polymerase III gamma/tau subunit
LTAPTDSSSTTSPQVAAAKQAEAAALEATAAEFEPKIAELEGWAETFGGVLNSRERFTNSLPDMKVDTQQVRQHLEGIRNEIEKAQSALGSGRVVADGTAITPDTPQLIAEIEKIHAFERTLDKKAKPDPVLKLLKEANSKPGTAPISPAKAKELEGLRTRARLYIEAAWGKRQPQLQA